MARAISWAASTAPSVLAPGRPRPSWPSRSPAASSSQGPPRARARARSRSGPPSPAEETGPPLPPEETRNRVAVLVPINRRQCRRWPVDRQRCQPRSAGQRRRADPHHGLRYRQERRRRRRQRGGRRRQRPVPRAFARRRRARGRADRAPRRRPGNHFLERRQRRRRWRLCDGLHARPVDRTACVDFAARARLDPVRGPSPKASTGRAPRRRCPGGDSRRRQFWRHQSYDRGPGALRTAINR